MIAPLIALLIRAGIPARFAKAVLASLVGFSVILLILLTLHRIRSDAVQDHEAAITADLAPRQVRAAETAADTRARDTIAIANDTQEARNANAAIPDAAPTRQSDARNCNRMRWLNQDTSGVSACGGSGRPR